MGIFHHKSAKSASVSPEPPKLVSRRENRRSSFRMGRTIGEKRERLETKNEREAARKKIKNQETRRLILTILGFILIICLLGLLIFSFINQAGNQPAEESAKLTTITSQEPTIEIVDEDVTQSITSRMRAYVATAEQDFRALGYTPVRAVIPAGAIREVDFYLEGHPGFVKTTIDRDSAVTAEDADRMYRYLSSQDITDFTYIDVRLPGKAYWK